MAWIEAGGRRFDVDLVVFDKDGTLVDFEALWAGKLRRAVALTVAEAKLEPEPAARLLRVLGVDPETLKIIPETPIAVTTLPKLGVVCTVGLHQAGMPWHRAEAIMQRTFLPAIEALPDAADLVPIADPSGLMAALAGAGVRSAILTSDDRAATEASLAPLGIAAHVATMVCGDDPIRSKPAPDGLFEIVRRVGVGGNRVAMVGDSAADMQAGLNAGIACRIAVTSGVGVAADLSTLADVVIPDIGAICVL